MSSCMVLVLSGILLGQIYINSGEKSKTNEKEQIQLLRNANTVFPKNQEIQTNITQNNSTTTEDVKKNCIFRIENGDHLIGVNKTRQELEEQGLQIFDEVCEGDLDPNGDKISSGALASLCCG